MCSATEDRVQTMGSGGLGTFSSIKNGGKMLPVHARMRAHTHTQRHNTHTGEGGRRERETSGSSRQRERQRCRLGLLPTNPFSAAMLVKLAVVSGVERYCVGEKFYVNQCNLLVQFI